ncbi:AimR family lysis-lysogeny pheromone receptor [Terribacillus saccharophilus]|uniref:HTH cro/C1-type domain-containing protein n=1 Tax=Terribacillus saccharophilus TaxID=361277 RepID=A0ABX4H0B4_9BACI|nr:AimR family lysis-lysogeny pheromone receptor [Terribacillus saccharophilus]PAD35956.1 hypothetical protein CHH56_05895 [Terribacillus saccharophilus]PAD96994.1 hypothetical protein CHH50_06415 [Terribacillus saccharophilus]PAE00570.1 hypothetical protein CHH48_07320 [Terribacillus saccharophilus]
MKPLSLQILNRLDELDMTAVAACKLLGITQGAMSGFTRGLHEMSFNIVLRLPEALFDGKHEIVRRAALLMDGPLNIRASLEYLYNNDYHEDLVTIIENDRQFLRSQDIYEAYRLAMEYQKCRFKSYDELTIKLDRAMYFTRDKQAQALLKIIQADIAYQNREFKTMRSAAATAREIIGELKDTFFKNSYTSRIDKLFAHAALFEGNLPEAREYAQKVIDAKVSPKLTSDAYYILGTSYWFEDQALTLDNLRKSSEILRAAGREDMAQEIEMRDIETVKTYYGIDLDVITDDMDPSEKAFRYAKRGDKAQAIEILDSIPETAFRLYYRGIAENDCALHLQSLLQLMKGGDNFYIGLPLSELMKDEFYRNIALKLTKKGEI